MVLSLAAWSVLAVASVNALSISEIQGPSFQSPYAGQVVHDVFGVVSAKDAYGFWLAGEPTDNIRVSNGIRVYGHNVARAANIGDLVSLSGKVTEYRNRARPNDLYLTEIENPTDIRVHSSDNTVLPVVLGEDRIPPAGPLSAHDKGPDSWLSVPGNQTLVEAVNATLQPDLYGLDFWESLEGQLVTIKRPTSVSFPDRFGSFWVHGDWTVNGKNARGGLSLVIGPDNTPSAHAEAILIGHPLDRSQNPKTHVGVALSEITGIVTYQFGFYTILPLTAAIAVSVPEDTPSPAAIHSTSAPCELTIGDYNVENMSPRSHHIPRIADHIANYLNTPDIVFVQEIQDDSGTRNDGVVNANKTLSALVNAIAKASNGVKYEFVNIPPLNNMDGGQPGSNIRVAYLWRPEKVSLVPGSFIGNATESTAAVSDKDGKVTLSFNPGRVDPLNPAWEETRKPLVAAWQTTSDERFFTVNVHLSSKRFSTSTHGDARPPINGRSEQRTEQVKIIADFVTSILAKDVNASIIVAGDMNEFVQTRSVFRPLSSSLTDINELAGIPQEERYTYVYDQHTQEIDQIFVSEAIGGRGVEVEHVHVNTWAPSVRGRASDHDPTVAKVRVCEVSSYLSQDRYRSPVLVVQEY